jgi:hypothetical protein
MGTRVLAVIERGRVDHTDTRIGEVADEVEDLLHFCIGVRGQFGSMDLVLRGSGALMALAPANGAAAEPSTVERYLRTLSRIGVRVWADGADLARLGPAAAPLLQGVTSADTDALARMWGEYEQVWFL